MNNGFWGDMNWKQRIFATIFWILASPYMIYSLIVQLVVYNLAVFLFNLDLKTQKLLVQPYDFVLNYLQSENNND